MKVLVVICFATLHVISAAQSCNFPADIDGTWLQEGDFKMESNSENCTLKSQVEGQDMEITYNCFMSAPENGTFIAKRTDNEMAFMCFAYKKINSNVFIGYLKSEAVLETAPSNVYEYCGDLLEYPKPGKVHYNAQTLEAVQCAPIGKFQYEKDTCVNKTSKFEVCGGDYNAIAYTEGCTGMDAPLINGSMDCLASWDGNDGLKYSLAKTGTVGEDDTEWEDKFVCMAYKLVNKTLTLTAKNYQCQGQQTDTVVNGNGLIASMNQVNDADDCIPPTADSSAIGVLTTNLNVAIFVTLFTVIAAFKL
ncbi:uncharacterized protein LOC144436341 [Glandiceps talaboti]